jgi:hypothetical protein
MGERAWACGCPAAGPMWAQRPRATEARRRTRSGLAACVAPAALAWARSAAASPQRHAKDEGKQPGCALQQSHQWPPQAGPARQGQRAMQKSSVWPWWTGRRYNEEWLLERHEFRSPRGAWRAALGACFEAFLSLTRFRGHLKSIGRIGPHLRAGVEWQGWCEGVACAVAGRWRQLPGGPWRPCGYTPPLPHASSGGSRYTRWRWGRPAALQCVQASRGGPPGRCYLKLVCPQAPGAAEYCALLGAPPAPLPPASSLHRRRRGTRRSRSTS